VKDDYVRNATVVRVIDGDTLEADLDLGWRHTWRSSVRLAGLNARELRDPGGPEARDHLARLLPPGTQVVLRSIELDKFGRSLATVWEGKTNINRLLLEEGWAAPYDGHGLTSAHVPVWPRP
jgi:endonuclease YncB( thermonuclease family)